MRTFCIENSFVQYVRRPQLIERLVELIKNSCEFTVQRVNVEKCTFYPSEIVFAVEYLHVNLGVFCSVVCKHKYHGV